MSLHVSILVWKELISNFSWGFYRQSKNSHDSWILKKAIQMIWSPSYLEQFLMDFLEKSHQQANYEFILTAPIVEIISRFSCRYFYSRTHEPQILPVSFQNSLYLSTLSSWFDLNSSSLQLIYHKKSHVDQRNHFLYLKSYRRTKFLEILHFYLESY